MPRDPAPKTTIRGAVAGGVGTGVGALLRESGEGLAVFEGVDAGCERWDEEETLLVRVLRKPIVVDMYLEGR